MPLVNQEAKDLIAQFERGFFDLRRWAISRVNVFVVPDQGCSLDAHDIQTLRPSTADDFASAKPKPMRAYTNGNSLGGRKVYRDKFEMQVRHYHFCKKVAVSFDGKIYRATDAEIEAALHNDRDAPLTDAATYVKAVQELRRRHALMKPRKKRGRGESGSGQKRRRVKVAT